MSPDRPRRPAASVCEAEIRAAFALLPLSGARGPGIVRGLVAPGDAVAGNVALGAAEPETQSHPARIRGDHDLNAGQPRIRFKRLTAAAVLVGLCDRPDGMTVLLTERTQHLTDHAGQIAFPGGRIEPDDPHPEAAALREAEEEVGLPPDHVEIIGRLDTYVTGTGFEIVPVVGLVRTPFPLAPDPFEVAEVFEVPLSFVLDPANHERRSMQSNGGTRQFFVLPFEQRYIWGATAGMLVNLAEILGR